MLDSLARVLGSAEEEGVGTGRAAESELVEGDGLTSGGDDASTGGGGEAEGGNRHLGDGEEAVVVGDGSDNDDGPVGGLALGSGVAGNLGKGDRGTVQLGHEQPAEDDLVERRVRATGQEAVQLHEELDVHIVALRRLFGFRKD